MRGKSMKMTKKTVCIAFVACFFLLSLVGCTRADRINYAEFAGRMKKCGELDGLGVGETFCNKSAFYTYYSFEAENDVLLIAVQDKYERINRVTLTASEQLAEESNGGYLKLCRAVVKSLCFEKCDVEKIIARSGVQDSALAGDDGFSEYSDGIFTFWVFRSVGAVTFAVDIKDNALELESDSVETILDKP